MSNVVQFRSRAQLLALVPLYRLSLARAKALGMCPEPANDTRAATLGISADDPAECSS